MALSGTLTGSCTANNGASSRYDYKIEWSATQNVTANTSTITATAYVRSNNSNYSTSTNWTSIINGTKVKTFQYHIQASAGWVNFGSKTWTVNHNADGTCTTSISGSFSGTYNGSYVLRSGSVSGNITLNTIPRASSFTLNRSSATIGTDAITVTISRASSSFTHTVIYKFGSISADQATKTNATSVTFTPVLSDCSQIPNATSGTATVVVDTYNGSTKIGTASKTITLNVPSNVVPSIGSVTATGNNLLGSVYVAGKSTVTAKINSASGSQGSTIKSYHLSGAGLNNSSSSATSGTLSAGTHTITGKVTDSRGRTASKSTNITVYSYASPTISASVYRCNSNGQATDDGTFVRANITANVDNVGNANVNAKQYKIERKTSQGSNWSTYLDWTNLSTYSATWVHDLGGNWANTTSYDVRISVKDSYGTVSATRSIGTVACVLNVEEAGVGVGKIHERGALDVAGTIYMNGQPVMTSIERPVSGNWFRGTPSIAGDGVMEVGKYIDFHSSNTETADFSVRLTANGSTLTNTGTYEAPTIKATGNGKSGTLGTGSGDVYLHNSKGNSYWQFKDNGHFGIPNHLVFQGSSERRVILEGSNKGLYFNNGSFGFYDWAGSASLLRIDLNNKEIRSDGGYFATAGNRMITSRTSTGYISWNNSTDWKYSLFCQTNTSNNAAASSLTNGAPAMKLYSGSGGGLWLFPAGDSVGGMVVTRGTGWGSYGDVTCNKTYAMSDERLKKNITPLDAVPMTISSEYRETGKSTGSIALDIIKGAKAYAYDHVYDDDSLPKSFGLMAQDLPVELTKQFVRNEENPDDMIATTKLTMSERNSQKEDIAVDIYGISAVAWEGVRVLTERVEALEDALAEETAKRQALEERLSKLEEAFSSLK